MALYSDGKRRKSKYLFSYSGGTTRSRKPSPLRCWTTFRPPLALMRSNIFWVLIYFISSRTLPPRLAQLSDEPLFHGRSWPSLSQSRAHLRQHWKENEHSIGPEKGHLCTLKDLPHRRLHENEKNVIMLFMQICTTRRLQTFEEVQKDLLDLKCSKWCQSKLHW